jgi:hypothetical protein
MNRGQFILRHLVPTIPVPIGVTLAGFSLRFAILVNAITLLTDKLDTILNPRVRL